MGSETEILTPDEFMRRMKIGKTTYHKWKSGGVLRAGRDFFKNGKIIRIVWGPDLIQRLLESSSEPDSRIESEGQNRKAEKVRPPSYKSGINWDY